MSDCKNHLQIDMIGRLTDAVRLYVRQNTLVAPLSMEELRVHGTAIIESNGFDSKHHDLIAVLINNETWRDIVAGIPYDRRLLLLPQCLRSSTDCRADFDELGLICNHCGQCMISDIKRQAEQLGYAVLVAEGSPIVMKLIESGQIEAVVGVSCLAVLERTFPYMEAGAVPGIAVPLLYDGCVDTKVNLDWLVDSLYLNSTDRIASLDLNAIKEQIGKWFDTEALGNVFGVSLSKTERIAVDWMGADGKRWRPFLTVSCYYALSTSEPDDNVFDALRNTAIAVECFHKASLIHDDIEDNDDLRYGRKTMHAQYGVPVALNAGDLLIGAGYKLIADLDIDALRKADMLKVAADGHTNLCLGQGTELMWTLDKDVLSADDVIEIFRKKTSPAFMVALKLGAILAGADSQVLEVLSEYSDALGIAYQIRDDIEDHKGCSDQNGPSLMKVLAEQDAERDVISIAKAMGADYRSRAVRSLSKLSSPMLKGLLRRLVCKIFDEIENLRCCDDYKAEHDPDRQ